MAEAVAATDPRSLASHLRPLAAGRLMALPQCSDAAAAKSRPSCRLCDPIDGSPPGSRPWDSPGKNTGVGSHFLLQCMKVKSESEVAQSCPTLRDPMDCSPPGSSVHGILQARALEWGAIAFSAVQCRAVFFRVNKFHEFSWKQIQSLKHELAPV